MTFTRQVVKEKAVHNFYWVLKMMKIYKDTAKDFFSKFLLNF